MSHPSKAGVATVSRARRSVASDVPQVNRDLARLARDAGGFDASRYFRSDVAVQFFNVGTTAMRALARSIQRQHSSDWTVRDALAFADLLIRDRHLETKSVGIEVLACYREQFSPRLLAVWKRWLAGGHSSNWATTDAICGYLIGPLLVRQRPLVPQMRRWARHRSLWVRRAAAVSLVGLARKGVALNDAYAIARALHADSEDLIQKAVGWLLREAGKTDPARLEDYLRMNGPAIPRTTLRYAVERMPEAKRLAMLKATRGGAGRTVAGGRI